MESGPAGSGEERAARVAIAAVSAAVVLLVAVLLLGRPAGGTAGGAPPLATVNAILNGTSAALLATGYALVRSGRPRAHRAAMLAAFTASALFLASYLAHHATSGSRAFGGQGWIRWVYFPVLISHVVLAAVILPLALGTLYRAWRGQFERHRRLARWTLPLWLYVSVTGVVVYWLLYY